MENFGYNNPISPYSSFSLDADAYNTTYQHIFSPSSSSVALAGDAGFQAQDQSRLEKRRQGKKSTGGVRLSTDPQSVAARERRHRISNRFKMLQSLVPGGSKMDTVSMLEEAIHYVKFLKAQIWFHQNMMVSTDHQQDQSTTSTAAPVLPSYPPTMTTPAAATSAADASSLLLPPQQSFGYPLTAPFPISQPSCSFQGDQDEMFPYGSSSIYFN